MANAIICALLFSKRHKVVIEQVKHTQYLGIIFDDNLNWSNHISYINSKIAKRVGIICRAKKYFTTTTLINLYNAFIFPYLIYCVEVWGNALSIHLTPLLKLQNKILRINTITYHRIDKDQLFYNTGILPFDILVKHRIGLLMHNLSNGNVAKPLQNLYQCNKMSTIILQDRLTISTLSEEIMSLFIECLFFRVFSYGIQFYRILILIYLMLASSIYLKNCCYPMILPFDMTNKTQFQWPMTNFHLSFYHYA